MGASSDFEKFEQNVFWRLDTVSGSEFISRGIPSAGFAELEYSAVFEKFDQSVFFTPDADAGLKIKTRAASHLVGVEKIGLFGRFREIIAKGNFQTELLVSRSLHDALDCMLDVEKLDQNVIFGPSSAFCVEFMTQGDWSRPVHPQIVLFGRFREIRLNWAFKVVQYRFFRTIPNFFNWQLNSLPKLRWM